MAIKLIERKKGRIYLQLQLIWMGADVCLIITGGNRPHLGAVAVAQIRESLAVPGKLSSTVSNITLLGHKEDDLARTAASRVAAIAASNVVACCGIHIDDISADEIEEGFVMCNEMIDELIGDISSAQRAGTVNFGEAK